MKTKKMLALMGLFCIHLTMIVACSCSALFICEYIEAEASIVAFQARVIKHREYSPQNLAVYLEVIKRYKDEVGMTDTIKLYGMKQEASCDVYFSHNRYPVGDTVIMAIGTSDYGYEFYNPDSLFENYWEYRPNLCKLIYLKVNDGTVVGIITNKISEYPLSWFDEQLEECGFSLEQLQELKCSEDSFILFPNPSATTEVSIRGKYSMNTFERIRVFAADGRLLSDFREKAGEHIYHWKLKGLREGLNIIEITCNGQVYYKKVIVEQ